MGILYVASSKGFQTWAGDVGLGKHVYKVGLTEEQTPEQAVSGLAGFDDWKILLREDSTLSQDSLIERLSLKEKLVDPNYYPKIRGDKSMVKVTLAAVENALLVAIALDNREPPKAFKVKPVDIAHYLVRNLKG